MIQLFVFIVVIVGVGAGYLAFRNRQPNSIESGITSFRREMNALAPGRRRSGSGEPAPGVGPLRDHDQPGDA